MRLLKVGQIIEVVATSDEHWFKIGEELKIIEVMRYGVVWAKNKDGQLGCLIPSEYVLKNDKK